MFLQERLSVEGASPWVWEGAQAANAGAVTTLRVLPRRCGQSLVGRREARAVWLVNQFLKDLG